MYLFSNRGKEKERGGEELIKINNVNDLASP